MIPDDPTIEEFKSILQGLNLVEVSLGRCRKLCAASGRPWDFKIYTLLGKGYYDYEINDSGRGELIFKGVQPTANVEVVYGEEEPDQGVELY